MHLSACRSDALSIHDTGNSQTRKTDGNRKEGCKPWHRDLQSLVTVCTHVLSAHRWMPHSIPHPTVLDSSIGKPAQDVKVQLLAPSVQEPDQLTPAHAGVWVVIGSSVTNEDGRCSDLVPPHLTLPTGTYQIVFETKEYFDRTSRKSFYPFVQVSGP